MSWAQKKESILQNIELWRESEMLIMNEVSDLRALVMQAQDEATLRKTVKKRMDEFRNPWLKEEVQCILNTLIMG